VLAAARSGDFVYFDSPYDVEVGAVGFTSYAASRFGPPEQDLQAEVFRALDRRGCKLMLSNSDTIANRSRYARFDVREVLARRSISRNGAQRQAVTELVVRNYA
jgi:DNA adenine methylase